MDASRRLLWPVVIGFFLASVLVYGQSLGNGFVRWDDALLITDNPVIRGPLSALPRAFFMYDPELYIPLTFVSYKIDYLIGGVSPMPYHLQSLLLHVLNALLVTELLRRLLKRSGIAVFLGLLFLLHPLHTEAVAWASGRKDLLSTAFGLGAMLAYLTYRRDGSRAAYRWSLILFTLGLGSKVMIITLPVLLLLLDEWDRRPRGKAMLLDKLPYLGLSAVFGVIAVFGKTTVLTHSTPLEKILMAFKSTAFYFHSWIAPFKLSVLYPYSGTISAGNPDFYVPALVVLALGACVLASARRTRAAYVASAFFLVSVAPTFLNFAKGELDLYIASDRYAYLPSVGLLLLTGALLAWLAPRMEKFRGMAAVLGSLLLLGCAFLTNRQSLVWKDTETLFTHVIRTYPQSYVAHANLANAYRLTGRDDDAIREFQASLAIKPHARTEANLGAVYRKEKKYAEAAAAYERALALDPESKEAHFGLGILQAERGQASAAEASYRKAVEIDPAYGEAWTNLGSLLLRQGKLDEAAGAYAKAIAADPLIAETRYNLGVLEMKRQRTEEAIEAFTKAISLDPTHIASRLNLGVLLYNAGEHDKGIAQFRMVLRLDPDNAAAREALRKIQ